MLALCVVLMVCGLVLQILGNEISPLTLAVGVLLIVLTIANLLYQHSIRRKRPPENDPADHD